jgi:integrase
MASSAHRQRVQVFSIGAPPKGTPTDKRRHRVKWRIDGRDRTRAFKTKVEADRFRTALLVAVKAGDRFDDATGEPISWTSQVPTWFEWSRQWLELKWPQWAGTSRRSAVETLISVAPLMVRTGAPNPPDDLVPWLRADGYPASSPEVHPWLHRWSTPLDAITPADLEQVLVTITTRLDGKPTAASVSRRRRNVVGAVLRAAVRRDFIERNPIDRVEWRTPARDMTVDVATVPSTADVLRLVDHVASLRPDTARYAALFACIGLAGMRPSEAISLRRRDLDLPEAGWGHARVGSATTDVGARYTDDGQRTERKGLKHRASGAVRDVPLPPPLVERLRHHCDRWQLETADALFTTKEGSPMTPSGYWAIWQRARSVVWGDDPALATATAYDLRHSAATMMLRAGAPPAEVALRLGHSIDVLLRVYAGVLSDDRQRTNELIDLELASTVVLDG